VNLTKEQLAQLAELVRTTPEQSAPVALLPNLCLFAYGFSRVGKVMPAREALTIDGGFAVGLALFGIVFTACGYVAAKLNEGGES
jgi:uncharacterized membrane protein